ncbi:tripartite tricarboxylate transporter substrate binding protein [Pseudacidovorax sp. RU35E]|uniref:Bug family tripartite tricarboxylate transporter substrate binding protein n=1 Tax=Pseudacidovorax sp. RU35E TaxID=1907403 RepID=UPI00095678BF|nr:tripartite tricarboxylate transporter substrate binding protein [Pseudacidovorax sp. RU35E]SIR58744.1 Tripartite-type tricarboxylate transporter, receptor component TctC [Pseudacidovorax sp. RU35E]
MNPLTLSRLGRRLLAGAAALALSAGAMAQAYPTKPVRVIVAFTAGGTTDILARATAQKLTEKLGQPFVIDNKPGAGGNIGTEMVVRAAPDGYTLIVNSVGPMTVNQTLYKNLPYDPLKDLVPVVQIADVPNVLVVHPSVPAKDLAQFIAYAKANPGKLSYGSTGVGTSSHLSSFMLSQRSGVETVHVPYKGANALTDLLAGRLQFMFATAPTVIQHIRAGKLRALAVSGDQPSRSLPGVPTVAEKGFPGFSASSWFGFFAPKGTPASVIQLINKTVNDALPSLEEQLVREGAEPAGGTPERFGAFAQREHEKWKAIVRDSGATAE